MRTRLDNDERRKKLLDLGVKLFGKRTYDELSIGSIAGFAGVSKGLLYHYFPTKRNFYIETLRASAEEMLRLTESPKGTPGETALRDGLEAYLDYVTANAPAYVSLIRSGIGSDPEVYAVVDEVRNRIIERMLGLSKMENPTDIQTLGLKGWIGFVEHATLSWLETKRSSRAELRELLMDQFRSLTASLGGVNQ